MRLFISYSHDDANFARRLRDQLHQWEYDTWLDSDNIPHGAYWPDAIDAGLRASDVVVGIMTPDSVSSRNVKNEWDWALSNSKPLLLLLLRSCPIPHRYISINYLDFTESEVQGFVQLREALQNPAGMMPDDDGPPLPHAIRATPVVNTSERNRARMLDKVRTFWVNGVLDNSLHGAALLELGMESRAQSVERPWDIILQHSSYEDYSLPSSTHIIDVFDDLCGELLILGDPGSGKTTTMLELARDLLDRAQSDHANPIPVVFNLSSWADGRKPIAEWLVSELNARYQVPKPVGQVWIENEQVLPLLDGLDEVAYEYRSACVEAINQFRQQYGLVPLVVCSRVVDYDALSTRLKLQGAVLLQPLTQAQIDAYLDHGKGELTALKRALHNDDSLRELAQTPLMLSIMSLAYRGVTAESLPEAESVEEQRTHLFGAYVQRMFERRSVREKYSPVQTVRYLSWLAAHMQQEAQTVFLIERLQPDWLPSKEQKLIYRLLAWAAIGLPVGLPLGLTIGLITNTLVGLLVGVGITSLIGLTLGPIGDYAYNTPGARIRIIETLGWSWRQSLAGVGIGLIIGVIAGLIVGTARQTPAMLAVSVAGALSFGVVGGVAGGLTSREVERRTIPNQGIRRSASNALRVGVPLGIAAIIAGTLALRLAYVVIFDLDIAVFQLRAFTQLNSELIFGVLAGLTIGLAFAMFFGLLAVLRHAVLRAMLYRNGSVPLNYARFLDYAAERIFLRKVGGGYIFIHRLLLDYFAGLNSKDTER
jgi:DNA polymerase III delta prime subunit